MLWTEVLLKYLEHIRLLPSANLSTCSLRKHSKFQPALKSLQSCFRLLVFFLCVCLFCFVLLGSVRLLLHTHSYHSASGQEAGLSQHFHSPLISRISPWNIWLECISCWFPLESITTVNQQSWGFCVLPWIEIQSICPLWLQSHRFFAPSPSSRN